MNEDLHGRPCVFKINGKWIGQGYVQDIKGRVVAIALENGTVVSVSDVDNVMMVPKKRKEKKVCKENGSP